MPFSALSGPVRCGTSTRPNQCSGRSPSTESNHQPDSGTANSSTYSKPCPARAACTCQRGIAAGSRGRRSKARQARRNTASASTVKPIDLCKSYTAITLGFFGKSTMISPIGAWTRINATIVQWKTLARLPQ